MNTETYTNPETGKSWGWTRNGRLTCQECGGRTQVTCRCDSGQVNEFGDCRECDGEGVRGCRTCER